MESFTTVDESIALKRAEDAPEVSRRHFKELLSSRRTMDWCSRKDEQKEKLFELDRNYLIFLEIDFHFVIVRQKINNFNCNCMYFLSSMILINLK